MARRQSNMDPNTAVTPPGREGGTGHAMPAESWSDDERDLARLARGLAHPLRLRILRLLRQRGECVCGDIVSQLPRAQSTVSQHLKVLKEAGLIRGEVEPPNVCYCLDEEALQRLRKWIETL